MKNEHFRREVRPAAGVKGRIWEASAGKLALPYLVEQYHAKSVVRSACDSCDNAGPLINLEAFSFNGLLGDTLHNVWVHLIHFHALMYTPGHPTFLCIISDDAYLFVFCLVCGLLSAKQRRCCSLNV